MKNKIKSIFLLVLTFFVAFVIVGSIYYYKTYPKQDFDVILFTFTAGVENTSSNVVSGIVKSCIGYLLLLWIILLIPTVKHVKNGIYLKITRKKHPNDKYIQVYPIKLVANHSILYSIFIVILAGTVLVRSFGIDVYIKNQMQNSTIFEEYYVDARNVKVEFPETKRNLILILGESFENSVFSNENGGGWGYSLMPELETLALENTNFSNSTKLGGALPIYGTSYSAAGNIAITAGIPLKVSEFSKDANKSVGSAGYMVGSYSLGEVLQDNGYNLEIIMGSDGTFGNRKQYYESNGGYKVFDLDYAIQNGKMTEADKIWWGFNDDSLYEWSKEEINHLAAQDKPFNYIMLTADTHFTDGYLSPKAEQKYDNQYENVHAYASKIANDFVNWVKDQDFYENTTIVIIGDHLGMQQAFYGERLPEDYVRTIYNVFINPAVEATNTTNRTYTAMDYYPTILASMGVSIEGDRLGLGTYLYSDTPTLSEQLGLAEFEAELKKNSKFYNTHIMGDEYYKLKRENASA